MPIKRIPATPNLASDLAAARPALTAAAAHAGTSDAQAADRAAQARLHRTLNAEDGTHQLLVSGFWTLLAGALAALLTLTVFGGIGPQGPHTNGGWLSLMISMMSTPFAILLLLLGSAKWLRNLRLSRQPQHPRTRG